MSCDLHILLRSHLRLDTIAQILTQVNAHASSKLLLVETCQGLLAGALLERMGGGCGLWYGGCALLKVKVLSFFF